MSKNNQFDPKAILFALAALVLLAAGCTPPSSTATPAPPMSLWGDIMMLGQTEQSQAPALIIDSNRIMVAWVGTDDTGINQHVRLYTNNTLASPLQLPLPSTRPYAQQLAAGLDGNIHLLWLDANDNNETRLYAALITTDMSVERSALVSERLTLRYTAIANSDGSLWTVWSGGFISEPGLYTQYIDPAGRIQASRQMVADADWPVLARTGDGTLFVFWIQATTGKIYRGVMSDGVISDAQLLGDGIRLQRGDRLTQMSAGLDHTHSYLFWNISRRSGHGETWFSSSPLDVQTWTSPQRLGVEWTTKSLFETGFNSGRAFPAQAGNRWVTLAAPLDGQFDTLPVTAQQADRLALVYFEGGEIVGYQDIAQAAHLIDPPILLTDRDRHLYLAWSQPSPLGYADLALTMTRRDF